VVEVKEEPEQTEHQALAVTVVLGAVVQVSGLQLALVELELLIRVITGEQVVQAKEELVAGAAQALLVKMAQLAVHQEAAVQALHQALLVRPLLERVAVEVVVVALLLVAQAAQAVVEMEAPQEMELLVLSIQEVAVAVLVIAVAHKQAVLAVQGLSLSRFQKPARLPFQAV
jgi:hypothetical protein